MIKLIARSPILFACSVKGSSARGHHPHHPERVRHHVGLRRLATRRRLHRLQAQESAQSQVAVVHADADAHRSHVVQFSAESLLGGGGHVGCAGTDLDLGRGCWDDPGNFRPKKLGALDDSDSLIARFVG